MTLRERYVRFFVQGRGYIEVETRSSKYTALRGQQSGSVRYVFLGKNGAVRQSKTNSVTSSIDVSYGLKKLVEQWEEMKGL